MALNYSVDVPLSSEAVMAIPNDGCGYEPSDEVTEWLDELTGHYWYFAPWWQQGNQYSGWRGLRFHLPTEEVQLMFKLAWGGV
jgi:hypothetical protein